MAIIVISPHDRGGSQSSEDFATLLGLMPRTLVGFLARNRSLAQYLSTAYTASALTNIDWLPLLQLFSTIIDDIERIRIPDCVVDRAKEEVRNKGAVQEQLLAWQRTLEYRRTPTGRQIATASQAVERFIATKDTHIQDAIGHTWLILAESLWIFTETIRELEAD